MSKDEVYTMLSTVSYQQSALGDKVLGLSIGGSGYANSEADRLNEVLLYADLLEDAYLRMDELSAALITDDQVKSAYEAAMVLLR